MSPVLIVIVVLAVIGVLAAAVFVLPSRLVPDLPDLGHPPPGDRVTLKDQFTIQGDHQKRRNDLRTGLLQAIAGLAVIATLLTTLLQLQATQKQATEQQDLTRRGQIADRFTKAIDQLGQSAPDKLDVRLGGIYALEQIARDAQDDQTRLAIYDVLTAFVREHAVSTQSVTAELNQLGELQMRSADIQAALTVLCRRGASKRDPPLDLQGPGDLRIANLSGCKLNKASLMNAHLERSDFQDATLQGALLMDAHLESDVLIGVNLESADLSGAHLEGATIWPDTNSSSPTLNVRVAHLEGARFINAHLEGANLAEANLRFAWLPGAHLDGAQLESADLRNTDLRGAHLEGVDLGGTHLTYARLNGASLTTAKRLELADLKGAMADNTTVWPRGFDWKAAGVEMIGG